MVEVVVVAVDAVVVEVVVGSEPWLLGESQLVADCTILPVMSCLLSMVAYAFNRLEKMVMGVSPAEIAPTAAAGKIAADGKSAEATS